MIIRDNFYKFCIKHYVVTPHLNHLEETVQMRGHNIMVSLLENSKPKGGITTSKKIEDYLSYWYGFPF